MTSCPIDMARSSVRGDVARGPNCDRESTLCTPNEGERTVSLLARVVGATPSSATEPWNR